MPHLVESAGTSVKQVLASEAARAGWLGDVDFTADIKGIAGNLPATTNSGDPPAIRVDVGVGGPRP